MEKPACLLQEICKHYKLMICSYGKWSMVSKINLGCQIFSKGVLNLFFVDLWIRLLWLLTLYYLLGAFPTHSADFRQYGMEIHTGDERKPDKKSKTEILFVAAPPSSYKDPGTFDNQTLESYLLVMADSSQL